MKDDFEQAPESRDDGAFEAMQAIPMDAMDRMHQGLQAKSVWEALERDETPALPGSASDAAGIIDALVFLKEKNTRHYSAAERASQHEKIDAYIEKLRAIK